ncbi:MAG: hypothetical protein ACJAVI_004438 [Candidatus Azotimanducaceae bacterium]|jgi:hypothetical protein
MAWCWIKNIARAKRQKASALTPQYYDIGSGNINLMTGKLFGSMASRPQNKKRFVIEIAGQAA